MLTNLNNNVTRFRSNYESPTYSQTTVFSTCKTMQEMVKLVVCLWKWITKKKSECCSQANCLSAPSRAESWGYCCGDNELIWINMRYWNDWQFKCLYYIRDVLQGLQVYKVYSSIYTVYIQYIGITSNLQAHFLCKDGLVSFRD